MHHALFVHLVWTTRDRQPLLDAARARLLSESLHVIARQERARILALGIVSTHLHLLLRVHPTTSLPHMLQRMKGGTAFGANRATRSTLPPLRWAKGYAVVSVCPRHQGAVVAYVLGQPRHHPQLAIQGWPPPPRGASRGSAGVAEATQG